MQPVSSAVLTIVQHVEGQEAQSVRLDLNLLQAIPEMVRIQQERVDLLERRVEVLEGSGTGAEKEAFIRALSNTVGELSAQVKQMSERLAADRAEPVAEVEGRVSEQDSLLVEEAVPEAAQQEVVAVEDKGSPSVPVVEAEPEAPAEVAVEVPALSPEQKAVRIAELRRDVEQMQQTVDLIIKDPAAAELLGEVLKGVSDKNEEIAQLESE